MNKEYKITIEMYLGIEGDVDEAEILDELKTLEVRTAKDVWTNNQLEITLEEN